MHADYHKWDEEHFNEEVQAFLEFEGHGTAHFQYKKGGEPGQRSI